jgi:outer membrane receptor protein involved in Fe transport
MINIVPRRPRRHGKGSADVGLSSSYASADQRWRNRVEVDAGSGRWAGLGGFSFLTVDDRDTGGGTLTPSDYEQFSADLALDYFLTNRSRVGVTAQLVRAEDISSPLAAGNSVNQPAYDRFYLALSLTSFDAGSFFHGTRASISLDTFFQDEDRDLGAGSSLNGESDVSSFDFHLEGQLQLFCCHTTYAELTVGWANLDRTETLLCLPEDPTRGGPVVGQAPGDLRLSRFIGRGATPYAVPELRRGHEQLRADELAITGILQDRCRNLVGLDRQRARGLLRRRQPLGGGDQTNVLVSGAGGLVYHLTQRMSVFGNASLGFRRPTLFELNATEVVDGRTLFGNVDLDPELHANLEVGTKMAMRDRWALQTAIFAHYTDDYIGPVDLAPGPDQALQNLDDTVLLGGELAASWRPFTTIEGLELLGTLGCSASAARRRPARRRRLGHQRPDLRHRHRPRLRGRRLRQLRRDEPLRRRLHARHLAAGGAGALLFMSLGVDF